MHLLRNTIEEMHRIRDKQGCGVLAQIF